MMTNQVKKQEQAAFGPLQVTIALLAVAAGLIHLVVLNAMMLSNPEIGHLDLLFTLNGLGYLGLVAALYLPLPVVQNNRPLARYALMGFAAVTIIAWVFMGARTSLGYVTKLIELALIVLLILESRQ